MACMTVLQLQAHNSVHAYTSFTQRSLKKPRLCEPTRTNPLATPCILSLLHRPSISKDRGLPDDLAGPPNRRPRRVIRTSVLVSYTVHAHTYSLLHLRVVPFCHPLVPIWHVEVSLGGEGRCRCRCIGVTRLGVKPDVSAAYGEWRCTSIVQLGCVGWRSRQKGI